MPLGRQSRCRLAPSNPLKAKVDGWGWKLWQALVGLTSPVSTHPKQQNPSRIQAQRVATWSAEPVPFSTFEPAKSIKGGWVGLEALAGIGWVDVTALGSIVGHQPLEHACETAACKGWWPMNASVGTCTSWPKMRWCSHWTELARRQGSQCFTLPLRLPLR